MALRAVPVSAAGEIERASAAFHLKYSTEGPHLLAIVRPEVLVATLRLEPRGDHSSLDRLATAGLTPIFLIGLEHSLSMG